MKEELIEKAGFSGTYERDRLNKLIDLVVEECLDAVDKTPAHCAFTTYDLGTVECTIQKSLDTITEKFNLKQRQRNSNERTMGRKVSAKDR
jgi:hypothetical protein